jgi:uncharacterized protein YyaL (SSP411 family)
MIEKFWDKENGGFYFTSHDHESLIVRNKDFTDNATPSGNSAAADVLLRLSKMTGDESYFRYATKILGISASQARRYPQGFGRALSVMEFTLSPTTEIVILGDDGRDLITEVFVNYLPDKVVLSVEAGCDGPLDIPLLEGRNTVDGKPTAYVCENMVCERPVTDREGLRSVLASK